MNELPHPTLQGFPLLPTTVVGSYPLSPISEHLMSSYYTESDPYHKIIEQCIREQVKAGVQIVSDGQTRASMVNIFASKLAGIRMKGKPVVFSEIRYHKPITNQDQEYVINILREMKGGHLGTQNLQEQNGQHSPENSVQKNDFGEVVLLKGVITGPFTMASSVDDTYYQNEKELAFAFARVLNQEARNIQGIVTMVQFDEPFFSVNYPDYASELITDVVKDVQVPVALHACGDIASIFPELVEMPVDILDHEFTANPHLLDVVKEYDFSQILGLGVVRSDRMEMETVYEIKERLRKALDHFGMEKLMVDPDCGMKHLTRDVAFQKLRNIRIARDEMMSEI